MSHYLLDEYARLLTTDTEACADLFTTDAEYRTRLGSHDLHFKGRDDIHGFIKHVPRQISFRAAHCIADEGGFRGELRLMASDLEPRALRVRYMVENGRIKWFEVLQLR